jgi:hypothetical protein
MPPSLHPDQKTTSYELLAFEFRRGLKSQNPPGKKPAMTG